MALFAAGVEEGSPALLVFKLTDKYSLVNPAFIWYTLSVQTS
jgi:hypothetical protein